MKIAIPIYEKFLLTIKEGAEYFNIGEKKLRQLVDENTGADFYLTNGVKVMIKREKFEKFVNELSAI